MAEPERKPAALAGATKPIMLLVGSDKPDDPQRTSRTLQKALQQQNPDMNVRYARAATLQELQNLTARLGTDGMPHVQTIVLTSYDSIRMEVAHAETAATAQTKSDAGPTSADGAGAAKAEAPAQEAKPAEAKEAAKPDSPLEAAVKALAGRTDRTVIYASAPPSLGDPKIKTVDFSAAMSAKGGPAGVITGQLSTIGVGK